MLFCPKVVFNCCSPFDEMKFHKNWFNFYQPKMVITIDKAKKIFERLSVEVKYWKEFYIDKFENLLPQKKHLKTNELIMHIKEFSIDPELRPILNELPKIL